jgi:Ca2+-binding EF-hand superfamily protein
MAGRLEIKLAKAGQKLSARQLEKLQDNFNLLDRDRDGKLVREEVGILFRAFGQTPRDEELEEMLSVLPDAGIDINQMAKFYSKHYQHPTSVERLMEALEVFDLNGSKQLGVEKFSEILRALGEDMPQEDIDHALREVEMLPGGLFEHISVAEKLIEGPRRIHNI